MPAHSLPFEPARRFRSAGDLGDEVLADCQGKRIAVLIVAYNPVTTLLGVLKRIPPVVWCNVEEVVLLDDASRDATFELAVGVKTLHDLAQLTVLKHPSNLGYGGNQKAGYRYLIERGFDVVVLLHGDGQYAPELFARMYAPLVRGEAEAVFGSRIVKEYGGPLKGGMPLYNFTGNRILTFLENRVLDMRLTEFHSGYRAYSVEALKQIVMDRMTNDFHFDTEIIIKFRQQGFRIVEIPIPTYYGKELCYVDGMNYARNVARSLCRYRSCVRAVRSYPEFDEYWCNFSLKEARYSSHSLVLNMITGAGVVSDVGCGEGVFAAKLAERGSIVTGIDMLSAPVHGRILEDYVRCDLSRGLDEALPRLGSSRYDCVLLLGVLEHLPDPNGILRQCRPLLKDSGRLIVSLPNVANITVRLMLLFGRWDYTDRGILGRTHLRFYTRRTGRELLERSGFEVTGMSMSVMPLELVLGIAPRSRLMRVLSALLAAATRLMPGLLGYQTIFTARCKRP